MSPFFSVVITLYNKEKYIKSTLESVLNQTFTDFEIIIINDGSIDNSLDVITLFKDEKIKIFTSKNKGASQSRNKGIELANSNYIALLDGDDLWDENYLNEMHKAISTNKHLSVFCCALAQKYNNKCIPVNYNFIPKQKYETHNYFKSSFKFSILSSSSIIFKKEIIEVSGDFDNTIVSGEDIDMWVRIGLNYDILFINKILAFYRHIPGSLSNSIFEASKKPTFERYKCLEKNNKYLKKFLDLNRYSLALMCKINNQKKAYHFYKNRLNSSNLSLLKRTLLFCPKWILDILLCIKSLKKEKTHYKPL
ncbi:glycosyltransferase family 2 protein [Olleya sp. HaHaR_3_96]|uniref:glycosyltransferase family 2 protein n=1 Tax=Olleya sp. HaHaR_3_96 TaxID=2745560 RepID=UPI001C4E61B9|nr:glycosyltransferase family 2 protein [Olleya sp. HaHaR_3_96]QXP59908.1 glycosyltransferase family 2 protein [Olleya sp. HaHaR_3_96]